MSPYPEKQGGHGEVRDNRERTQPVSPCLPLVGESIALTHVDSERRRCAHSLHHRSGASSLQFVIWFRFFGVEGVIRLAAILRR